MTGTDGPRIMTRDARDMAVEALEPFARHADFYDRDRGPMTGFSTWVEEDGFSSKLTVEDLRRAREALALLSQPPAPGPVRVRPLEWSKDGSLGGHGGWRGAAGEHSRTVLLGWRQDAPYEFAEQSYTTLDAAKAAAQADYERRVLSAIEPTPTPEAEPGLAEIRERLAGYPFEPKERSEDPIFVMNAAPDIATLLSAVDTLTAERDEAACQCVTNNGPNPDCGACGGDGSVGSLTVENLRTRAEAAEARLAEVTGALREHHQWHQNLGVIGICKDDDGQWVEIDMSDAYAEGALCERTTAALAKAEERADA